MSAEYRIHVSTPAGVLQAQVTDFLNLAYSKRVNETGACAFTLSGTHAVIDYLTHRAQIEVWRRNTDLGLNWTRDFHGFFLKPARDYVNGLDTFTATCLGTNWLLATRNVAWVAGTTDRSEFAAAKAETIMKTLVDYNAGANATTGNGRKRAGSITGLTVEADGAGGNTISWSCAWDNLLETLKRLAQVAGGDFDVVPTGAAAWQFRWYLGQLGTDRTATVKFSLPLGNLVNPHYEYDRTSEATAAIVAGQGEGVARSVVIRTGSDYSASNDEETFVDARDIDTTAGLNARGDTALYDQRAREKFACGVVQAPACYYGLHYFLGDLVTVLRWFDGTEITQKINAVTVTMAQNGKETVDVEMGTP